MTTNQILEKFFRAWLAWALSGGKPHDVFEPCFGLCANLNSWLTANKYGDASRFNVKQELRTRLNHDFGRSNYPFELQHEYEHRQATKTVHTSIARVEWVMRQVNR